MDFRVEYSDRLLAGLIPATHAEKPAPGSSGHSTQEHVVVSLDDWISDYITLLGEGTEEGKYLRSIPWILDADRQDPGMLIHALSMESPRFHELPVRPAFSLLAVLRETAPRHLRELILSCRCLSYQDWNLVLVDDGSRAREHLDVARDWSVRDSRIHLITLETPRGPCHAKNVAIEKTTGDYLILVDEDGVIHPMALGLLARHLNQDPNVNLVFSNEAEIDQNSTCLANFLLKPPFDPFTLLRVPYLGRLLAVRRRLLEDCAEGGPFFRHEYEGIEEHDLWLRLALTGSVVSRHAPLFAYYRRAGSASQASLNPSALVETRRRLLAEQVPRAYPGAVWTAQVAQDRDPLASSSVWITDLPGQPAPRLLVVIPFKDQVETTIKCLESIERQEHVLDVLIVLVNNRSKEPTTRPRLRDWIASPCTLRCELLDDDGAFNFARLNNKAIARFGHDRDLFLFLNNDVELSTPQTLQVMAMQLLADRGIGFVGIKLYYPGGNEIQHGGHRFVEHVQGSGYPLLLHAKSSADFVDAERVSLCVTFACAMTRRETFERLGGFEEVFFPNSFGDVDICLRALDAGYRNFYLGSLEGIHHESLSRGFSTEDIEVARFHERHGQTIAFWRPRHLKRAARHSWPLSVPPSNDPPDSSAEIGKAAAFPALPASETLTAPSPPDSSAEIGETVAFPALPGSETLTEPSPPDSSAEIGEAVAFPALPACETLTAPSPLPLPLRYWFADKVIEVLKYILGPAYMGVRSAAVESGNLCRRLKSPGTLYSTLRTLIKPVPLLGPLSAGLVRGARRLSACGEVPAEDARPGGDLDPHEESVRLPQYLRREPGTDGRPVPGAHHRHRPPGGKRGFSRRSG